ncbi:hypothetical protein NCCP2716_18900 [Sporosarcina sp. NCCP-2716]|uniref:flagellar protein FliS n=1 Tax=Sporosarcina sp. NCCP-2716 TaxID=2943679 RepID=UPI00203ABA29|nr:flagellar protein FliS [Sporosarcina sp. NCCP-2716]GKV69392.1 hypothetical protein NCCP2716_18900 [Sporosarcina sp. NCCP-2716]
MITIYQASRAYRKANAASLPPLTAVCRALAEIGAQLDLAQTHLADEHPAWRDALLTAQALLFELMAMTDTSTEEGGRLLTLYIYLNQTLVTVSLQPDTVALAEVQGIIDTLHADWLHVRESQIVSSRV